MSKSDNGPAFPLADSCTEYAGTNREQANGMHLRDYFAAKSMPLAMQRMARSFQREIGDDWVWDSADFEYIASHAYAMADAMLRARSQS